jgi:hypothetical protein
MGRFYANENVPAQEVAELRGPGHEVLKHSDAEKANSALPDDEVLASADVSQPTIATPSLSAFYFRPGFSQTGASHRCRQCGRKPA